MIDPQDFSIDAGTSQDVTMDIDPDVDGETLVGSTLYFRAYEQQQGMILPGVDPVIDKTGESDGIIVTDPEAQQVTITFDPDDTVSLLRNYSFEITVVGPSGNDPVRVAWGTMTVNGTEFRL